MKKVIIVLIVMCFCTSVAQAAALSISQTPGYSSRGGSGSYSRSSSVRVRSTTSRIQSKIPKLSIETNQKKPQQNPTSDGGFTTSFPKTTILNKDRPRKSYPRYYIGNNTSSSSAYLNSNNNARNSVSNSPKMISSCNGMTYYDRNGNPVRCN